MFSFLKEKLKGAISKFTKGAEEAAEEKPDPEQAITADQAALKAEKKGSDKETKAEQATKQKDAEKVEKEARQKGKLAEQAAKQKGKLAEQAAKQKGKLAEQAAKQKDAEKEKELAAKQKDAEKEKELAAKQKEVKKEKEAEKEEKEARQKEKEKEVELAAKLAEKEVEKVEQEKKAEQAKQEKEAERFEKEARHKEKERKAEQAKQQEAGKAEQAAKLAEKTIAEKAEQETDLTEKSEKEAAATQIPSSAQPQKRSWKERIFGPKTVQEGTPAPSEDPTEKQEKKGIFTSIKDKVTRTVLSPEKFDDLFWELEIALLENNVAVEVIEKIREDLKTAVSGKPMLRGKLEETIAATLQASIRDILSVKIPDLLGKIQEKKPYIICFIGINGSGKTTTISKIARRLKEEGLEVVLAAGDTFRAAAIDQLTIHADNLGVKIIKHDYGSDSAAVAFDAVKHAEAKGKDVVLIDTAGRMHSNANLMDELKKVVRVAKPDLKIFVGESITGNDCVEQAQQFDSAVGIDGIILTKADIDEKGGAALSISYVTRKPIYFIGVGQGYEDLKPFSPDLIMSSLGL